MLKYAIGHCVRRSAKRFFPLGLNVTKQRWTQFRHGNTSFAVFDVRSCAAVGEADPILFIYANLRVLMRMYVQYRQSTEINIDDTFFASICTNQAISRHGVLKWPQRLWNLTNPPLYGPTYSHVGWWSIIKSLTISGEGRRRLLCIQLKTVPNTV